MLTTLPEKREFYNIIALNWDRMDGILDGPLNASLLRAPLWGANDKIIWRRILEFTFKSEAFLNVKIIPVFYYFRWNIHPTDWVIHEEFARLERRSVHSNEHLEVLHSRKKDNLFHL